MKYSSVLVLATITVSQVLAGPVKHAHNHLHKKHAEVLEVNANAQEKRDWKDVNFATVHFTYSANQQWGPDTKTAAPVVEAAAKPTQAKTTTPAPVVVPTTTPSPSPSPSPETSSSSSPAAAASSASSSSASGNTGSVQNTVLSSAGKAKILAMGAQLGTNSASNNGAAWVGGGGPYTTTFTNNAGEDATIMCWTGATSWVNANAPKITHSLDAGASTTLSFASGVSGGCCAVFEDTILSNGQCHETWMEFTWGHSATVDVSREVNMNGHSMSLEMPGCRSDMNTCSFQCAQGEVSCWLKYFLINCENGSQPGANSGFDNGAPSGGCALGQGTHVDATIS